MRLTCQAKAREPEDPSEKETAMKRNIFAMAGGVAVLAVISAILLSGCRRTSESVRDDSAGMNGGFEIIRSGLPVNWLVYTPKTIPTGDYDLIIDTLDYQAGKQSLKFVVRECSPKGGWASPGLAMEYPATPGTTYTVGFWVKNDGAEFRV